MWQQKTVYFYCTCLFSRFIVQDNSLRADRLMSVVPLLTSCPITPSSSTRDTLLALFRGLQHPYIHPVLDIEFWEASVALVTPLNPIGSLRDLIYGCSWQQEYDRKYNIRGVGLPLKQVCKMKFEWYVNMIESKNVINEIVPMW